MKYAWEADIEADIADLAEGGLLDGAIQVIGVAVWNVETGEGAMIDVPSLEEARPGDIEAADVLLDVLGDTRGRYVAALEAIRKRVEQNGTET